MSNYNEKCILASVVMEFDGEIARGLLLEAKASLTIEHFVDRNHQEIYRISLLHLERGYGLDVATLFEALTSGARDTLTGLTSHSTSRNIKRQIDALKHAFDIRRLKSGLNTASSLLSEEPTKKDLDAVRSILNESLTVESKTHKDEGFLADYLGEFFAKTQELMTSGELIGIPFGMPSLDKITQGTVDGDLVTIAGRPGMGKSSFTAGMMVSDIILDYRPVLFSMELGRKEITDKIFSMVSELTEGKVVSFQQINKPSGAFGGVGLSQSDLIRLQEIATKYLVESVFYMRGASKITIDEVVARIRALHHEGNCGRVYIDHIGLLVLDKNNATPEITNITNTLKLLASELKISIVIVVQLNRGADDADGEPKLSHLKNSGSIEEDSSIVIFPWRPNAIDTNRDPSESKIIIAKSRNSGTGSFPTHFSTTTTMFTENVEPVYDDEPECKF